MVAVYIIIAIALLFIISISKKSKKKPSGAEDKDSQPEISDKELTTLKVYCCGGLELLRGENTIVTSEEATYEVKGFNLKGKEVRLNPGKVIWKCSCKVVKFQSEFGLMNIISCSIKGNPKRNVWVKYSNGVTFTWKIQFK